MTGKKCQWSIGFEGVEDLLCGKPGYIEIKRQERGTLIVCLKHAEDVQPDVKQNSLEWRLVGAK